MEPTKPSVLVIDDHPANRLAFEVVLEKDFDVRLAASGFEAVELAKDRSWSVILLDVRMPLMDGYETAAELRRQARTRFTPIVFSSAYERAPAHVMKELAAGAMDFILAPVEPQYLRLKLLAHARNSARESDLRVRVAELSALLHDLRGGLAKADAGVDASITRLERLSEELKRELPPVELLMS